MASRHLQAYCSSQPHISMSLTRYISNLPDPDILFAALGGVALNEGICAFSGAKGVLYWKGRTGSLGTNASSTSCYFGRMASVCLSSTRRLDILIFSCLSRRRASETVGIVQYPRRRDESTLLHMTSIETYTRDSSVPKPQPPAQKPADERHVVGADKT